MSRSAEQIFQEARAKPDPAVRAAYVDSACGADAALRAEVEALLKADAEAEGRLRTSVEAPPTSLVAAALDAEFGLGDGDGWIDIARRASGVPAPGLGRLGPYELLEEIGRGGQGEVYRSVQPGTGRPVAIKRLSAAGLRPGTRAHDRFAREVEAVTRLSHPNVVTVHAADVFDAHAVLVMELVDGRPIDAWSDGVWGSRGRQALREVLGVFMAVCEGVAHAHRQGVIHRDLKPSNILVDRAGRPRVLDFGIARLLEGERAEAAPASWVTTGFAGTPAYAPPEQIEGKPGLIDTRSDVYSLGVVLYRMISGREAFGGGSIASVLDAVRRSNPRPPSSVREGLPRELDWVVRKAARALPEERYPSVDALRDDVARYLKGEPLTAHPPSRLYAAAKFARRHAWPVSLASAAAVVIVALAAGSTVQAFHLAAQKKLAVERGQAADAARVEALAQEAKAKEQEAEARQQAAIAEAVAEFQADMLAAAHPRKFGDQVTVLQAVQAAVKELDAGSLKDQPLVEAGVRNAIGVTLLGLARYGESEPNLRKSLAIRRAALPAPHPGIARGLHNLAVLLREQNELVEAEPLFREAIEIRRAALPAGHPDIATSLSGLALLLKIQNKLAEAEPLYREALEINRAAYPDGHRDLATGLGRLAMLLRDQNKLAEAEPLCREALAIRRTALPAGHPDIALGINSLAVLLKDQNKLAEAEPLFREALAIRRTALPAGHPYIAQSLNNLAGLLRDQNRLAEAEPLCREALEIRRAAFPAGHPDIAQSVNSLAVLLKHQNKLAEAEPLFREALAISRTALPAGHPDTALVLNNLASLLRAQNRLAEAEPLYREALAICRAALPAGHPDIANCLSNLARVQHGLGQAAEARAGWDEAIAMLRQGSPDGSPRLARVLWRSGRSRLDGTVGGVAGDAAAALPELEEAVAMGEKYWPADHPHLKEYRETLAKCKGALAEQAKPEPNPEKR